MKAFLVATEDRPGEFARIGEAMGGAGVNIVAIGGLVGEGVGLVGFVVSDEAGARGALRAAGIEERDLDVVRIALPDEPGAMSTAARRLALAGVNLQLVLSTGIAHGKATVVIASDDQRKARSVLGDLVLED